MSLCFSWKMGNGCSDLLKMCKQNLDKSTKRIKEQFHKMMPRCFSNVEVRALGSLVHTVFVYGTLLLHWECVSNYCHAEK